MAIEFVTVQARTRGKSPQLFTYQGVGKLTDREVLSGEKEQKKDKDGKPVVDDEGKPVMVAAPIRNEDGSPLIVHDIDAAGIVDASQDGALEEVISLFAAVPSSVSPLQRIIDGSLNWFNVLQRKEASPVVEVSATDELTPIITEMLAYGILKEADVAVWRRNITSGANLTENTKEEYVKLTKEYRKLQAAKAVAV